MRITIAKLYARQRRDGATTLSGKMGYDGRLRIEPNPAKIEGDDKSPDFLAFIEYAEPKAAPVAVPYRGPQLFPVRPLQCLEGEVVE